MNAYCQHRACGRIFHYEPSPNNAARAYCSVTCKQREAYRIRIERHGMPKKTPKPRVENKPCALTGCKKTVPTTRRSSAIYCSFDCEKEASRRRKRSSRKGQPYIVERPKPAPIVVAAPVQALADPCQGCRWVKVQPASFRGVECSNNVFRACNPLGPEGPRLKEVG